MEYRDDFSRVLDDLSSDIDESFADVLLQIKKIDIHLYFDLKDSVYLLKKKIYNRAVLLC